MKFKLLSVVYNGPHVKTTYDKKIVNMLSVG